MPPAKPAAMLPVSCVVSAAAIAAASIIPSMPRLMMPLRCTMTSPSTASSSGVDATIASHSASIACMKGSEPKNRQDHDRLAERRERGGNVRAALQLSRACRQRSEEKCRKQRGEWMELRQKRDRDARVTVARCKTLKQAMRDAE